jgi:hypothetical protein
MAPHQLRLDRAVVALMRVHAADAVVPQLLRDESIWSSGTRDQVVTFVDGGPGTFITQSGYLNLWDTLGFARQLAEKDRAPAVTEWHVVRALNERRGEQLGWLQVHMGVIQHRLEEWLMYNSRRRTSWRGPGVSATVVLALKRTTLPVYPIDGTPA